MVDTTKHTPEDSVPFFPDHVTTELKVMVGVTAIVVLIGIAGMLFPLGLGAPADPMDTPAHVKPEWYFLALYQLLKFIPKTIGAVIPVILAGVVLLWPFFDRKPDKSANIYRIRLIVMTVLMIILIALTIWGEVS